VTKTPEQREAIYQILAGDTGSTLYSEMLLRLCSLGHEKISPQEFDLWKRFYFPVAKSMPYLYNGIVLEGRGLSWLARNLRTLKQRNVLS
jgi:hypothetical protein